MVTASIIQSSYIPWKGFFDIMHESDVFILYDDVQYTTRDWRTRNYIKSIRGRELLSVPVHGNRNKKICEIDIDTSQSWQKTHYKTLEYNYSDAKFFDAYKEFLKEIYKENIWRNLSQLNEFIIRRLAKILGLHTRIISSTNLQLTGTKTERLIDALKKVKANRYITGPSAKSYINESLFKQAKIDLVYKSYSSYPVYPQKWPPFDHQVSILDLLFNCGSKSTYFIWGYRE